MHRLRHALAGLWDSLFDVNQPPARYVGRALLLDLPLSVPVAILVGLAFPREAPDFSHMSVGWMLPLLCVVGPLLETVLMAVIFSLLRVATQRKAVLVALSTLIWMGLHSLGAAAHGLGIAWCFFILSMCYLNWEQRSLGHAFWITTALHGAHNLPFALLLMADRLMQP
jgi:hypothetical protein